MLGLSLVASAAARADWYSDTQSIMGTEVSITLWHTSKIEAQQLLQRGMTEMRRIDRTLSPWIEDSELARINRLAVKSPQPVSPEMERLIDKSLYFSKISDGAFDITFASVGFLYDYRKQQQPTSAQLKQLLPAINYRWLDLDRARHMLAYRHSNVRIDLGGIAKGHAVDQVAGLLEHAGVKHATISAGGDSRILGDRRGRPWMIGIKNPRDGGNDSNSAAIVLPLESTAVSTSGDYERYFIDEHTGRRVHHIINPRTGESAESVVSVTIIGAEGINTDPLSTTVFVLGVDKGLALINQLPGFDAVIIDHKGKVHFSDGLAPPSK